MAYTGDVLGAHSADSRVDVQMVGATFNDIFRSAHEASAKIGLQPCHEVVIHAPLGMVILECSGADAPVHIHVVCILKSDGNRPLMEMAIKKVMPQAVSELS